MSEEERLAAEWAALAEEDEDDAIASGWVAGSTRVLNQMEIDSLLGLTVKMIENIAEEKKKNVFEKNAII